MARVSLRNQLVSLPRTQKDVIMRFLSARVLSTLSIFLFSVSLSAAPPLTKIALSGEQAPGTAPGVSFFSFVSFYDPHSPVPLIDEQGRVLFFAFLSGPGVTAANGH